MKLRSVIILLCVILGGNVHAGDPTTDIIALEGCLIDNKRPNGADSFFGRFSDLGHTNSHVLHTKAGNTSLEKDYKGASESFAEITDLDVSGDDRLDFYLKNSLELENLGKEDEALDYLNKAIDEFPTNPALYYKKGLMLIKKGLYPDAVITLQEVVSLDPMYIKAHQELAVLNKDNSTVFLMASLRSFILEIANKSERVDLGIFAELTQTNNKTTEKANMDKVMDFFSNIENSENNFSLINYNLSLKNESIKINKSYTKKEIIKDKIDILCTSLYQGERWGKGFYWTYYAPYFIELHKNKFVDVVTHFLMAKNGSPSSKKWLDSHADKVMQFYLWNEGYNW